MSFCAARLPAFGPSPTFVSDKNNNSSSSSDESQPMRFLPACLPLFCYVTTEDKASTLLTSLTELLHNAPLKKSYSFCGAALPAFNYIPTASRARPAWPSIMCLRVPEREPHRARETVDIDVEHDSAREEVEDDTECVSEDPSEADMDEDARASDTELDRSPSLPEAAAANLKLGHSVNSSVATTSIAPASDSSATAQCTIEDSPEPIESATKETLPEAQNPKASVPRIDTEAPPIPSPEPLPIPKPSDAPFNGALLPFFTPPPPPGPKLDFCGAALPFFVYVKPFNPLAPTLLTLPNELLSEIAAYLMPASYHATSELYSLILTCRHLYDTLGTLHAQTLITRAHDSPAQYLSRLNTLITRGISVNKRLPEDSHGIAGRFPLHYACESGNLAAVKLLVSAGANLNARTKITQSTPLYKAIIHPNLRIVKYLLSVGADVNLGRPYSAGKEITPLEHAVGDRSAGIVRVLLAAGADPERHGRDLPVLHLATEVCARILFEAGADPTVKDRTGRTWTMRQIEGTWAEAMGKEYERRAAAGEKGGNVRVFKEDWKKRLKAEEEERWQNESLEVAMRELFWSLEPEVVEWMEALEDVHDIGCATRVRVDTCPDVEPEMGWRMRRLFDDRW